MFKEKCFSLEMGLSKTDFIDQLESQKKLVYTQEKAGWCFFAGDKSVSVRLMSEGVRQFGSTVLPTLTLKFDCSALDDTEQSAFIKLFLLKFQRGGA